MRIEIVNTLPAVLIDLTYVEQRLCEISSLFKYLSTVQFLHSN